jgi:hypothetical protein
MLRLRVTSERQPRWKKGQPAQSTTGVASANSIQAAAAGDTRWWIAGSKWPPISNTITGTDSTRPIHRRRVMSASSGFGTASAVTSNGSSAMPQMGQAPGPI